MKTILCAMAITMGALTFLSGNPAHARITRIIIDETVPLAVPPGAPPPATAYEQVAGRAFGELDPKHPGNAIIQDIELAKDADGKVRYVTSFVIYKPVDMSKASGMLWHDVPNRGRVFPYAPQERAFGDTMLANGWQGDNSGATAVRPKASAAGTQFLQVPVARGHKDQICYYAGGMIPFARTSAERRANNDPRPSLEERYGSHDGYVAAVKKAAERAVAEGFLLPEDATGLIAAADKSAVLR